MNDTVRSWQSKGKHSSSQASLNSPQSLNRCAKKCWEWDRNQGLEFLRRIVDDFRIRLLGASSRT